MENGEKMTKTRSLKVMGSSNGEDGKESMPKLLETVESPVKQLNNIQGDRKPASYRGSNNYDSTLMEWKLSTVRGSTPSISQIKRHTWKNVIMSRKRPDKIQDRVWETT